MQASISRGGFEADLRDLDETERAIEQLERRIVSQRVRMSRLNGSPPERTSAETLLAGLHASLQEMIKHRALIGHQLARRRVTKRP